LLTGEQLLVYAGLSEQFPFSAAFLRWWFHTPARKGGAFSRIHAEQFSAAA
jgi:hypothetical protein